MSIHASVHLRDDATFRAGRSHGNEWLTVDPSRTSADTLVIHLGDASTAREREGVLAAIRQLRAAVAELESWHPELAEPVPGPDEPTDEPTDEPALVTLAELNAASLTDEALNQLRLNASAGVRAVGDREYARRLAAGSRPAPALVYPAYVAEPWRPGGELADDGDHFAYPGSVEG